MFLVTTYRVREFRGHITDVAAGGILGVIAAIVQVIYMFILFNDGTFMMFFINRLIGNMSKSRVEVNRITLIIA